ncbi:hypothetical protein Cni_G15074 [Canna indica]|uniref:Protein kinase domain-containing protein n=1 Tax=Canna indica TaxID=4628 RepID=A0AAQ3KD69_9LILI|nr:hypothetical protein Cni_G15074 [Canna indica]
MMERSVGVLSFLLWICLVCRTAELCAALSDEGRALLALKDGVELDPNCALADWDEEDADPCSWFGVGCSDDGRVVVLALKDLCLKGRLSPELSKLVHLTTLVLHNNSFYGVLPGDIGKLQRLEVLDLGYNNFSGLLPPDLGDILSLETLILRGNRFAGNLSQVLYKLKMLTVIQVDDQFPSKSEFIKTLRGVANAKIQRHLIEHSGSRNNTDERDREKPAPESPAPQSPPPLPPKSPPPQPSPPPPPASSPPSKSPLVIAISAGGATCFLIALCIIYLYYNRRKKEVGIMPFMAVPNEQLPRAPPTGIHTFRRSELETACEYFSNIIGSFSDFTLYKGTLSNGVEIAVTSTTVTSAKDWSVQDEAHFKKKIKELSKVNHKNFLNLLGYCKEEEPFTRMLVFEYAPSGTLFEHLHIKEAEHLHWNTRLRIAMGVAYCLEHTRQLNPPLVLRNLNSSSVYLTEDYAAKISDLKFWDVEAKTNLALEDSNDSSIAYKFGIILLEIISGKLPYSEDPEGDGLLVLWASSYLSGSKPAKNMVDETLDSVPEEDINKLMEVIRSCINEDRDKRPTMTEVASRMRLITAISPEEACPKLSPLWWAELQIISV